MAATKTIYLISTHVYNHLIFVKILEHLRIAATLILKKTLYWINMAIAQ